MMCHKVDQIIDRIQYRTSNARFRLCFYTLYRLIALYSCIEERTADACCPLLRTIICNNKIFLEDNPPIYSTTIPDKEELSAFSNYFEHFLNFIMRSRTDKFGKHTCCCRVYASPRI